MKRARIIILLLALVLVLATGCLSIFGPKEKDYTISGKVTDENGRPIAGVLVNITGDTQLVINTFDENGGWSALVEGTVVVTPSHEEYIFDPEEREVKKSDSNVDFIGSHASPYEISGTVKDENGDPIDDVVINITGDFFSLVISEFDEEGAWSAEVKGTVTLIPSHDNYVFDPPMAKVSQPIDDISFVGTPADTYTIAGKVQNEFGQPIPEALVLITGQTIAEVQTDENGCWTADVRGSVEVTVDSDLWVFDKVVLDGADDQINLKGYIGDLLLHYAFDETGGDVAVDSSPNGLDGELKGDATFVEGLIGNAVSLGYLVLPDDILEGRDELTLSMWVKVKEYKQWARVFHFSRPGGQYYFNGFESGNFGLFESRHKDTTGDSWQCIDKYFPLDEWTLMTFTYSGTDWKYYFDATLEKEIDSPTVLSDLHPLSTSLIGWSGIEVDPFLDADIDDLRIYTKALAPEIIEAIYNAAP